MKRTGAGRAVGRWIGMAAALVVVLALSAVFDGRASGPTARGPLELSLSVRPVALQPGAPERVRTGALVYRGGLELSSADPRFGGLSDLRVSADGTALRAVSDCGYGLTAELRYDAEGRLAGLGRARLLDLVGLNGAALGRGERDAESLIVDPGGLEVGFEGKGRIWAYAGQPPFGGPPRAVRTPPGLSRCGVNGGIEAMTRIDGTRRLLVCENRRGASLDVSAWVGGGDAWVERSYPLLFAGGWAGEPFRATGAALLPDGDVLLVERRFPPIGCRVVRIPRAGLEGHEPLRPVQVAALESPLTVDNFEGIDARRDQAGRTLVYLLSDDNNCAKLPGGSRGPGLQRTLLLMFSLEG